MRALLVSLLPLAASICFVPRQDPAAPVWLDDLAVAERQAQRSGKPLMAVFRCEP